MRLAKEIGERRRWFLLGIIFMVALTSYVDRAVLQVLLEPIKEEFRLSDSALGLLGGAPFAICYALSSLPFARMADLSGRKRQLLIAMTIWSVMTGFCGLASAPWILFVGRMGVGFGEGGAIGSSHALVAEYFPPRQRNLAFGILTTSSVIGTLVALVAGAAIAAAYGWRAAFLVLALVSVPVLVIAAIFLIEPSRSSAISAAQPNLSLAGDIRALLAKPAYRLLLTGTTFYALFVYGALIFVPSMMMRVHGFALEDVGTSFGALSALATLIGTIVGSVFSGRLAVLDLRWLLRFPAIATLVSAPVALATFAVESIALFLTGIPVLFFLLAAALPPIFSAVQLVSGEQRRSMGSALLMGTINALGMTVGPIVTGSLSDAFSAQAGARGVGLAIMAMTVTLIPAGVFLNMASRRLRADLEEQW